jgi:hypothetical protein
MQLQTNRPAFSRYRIFPSRRAVLLAVLWLLIGDGGVHAEAPRLKGLVPHHAEESAMAEGDRLGIGAARLIGPERVEVYTHHTWRFVFEAGRAGIAPGGGLRVGLRHLACWTMPQTDDPQADGYLTATASDGQTLQIRCQPRELMNACFAWQQLV